MASERSASACLKRRRLNAASDRHAYVRLKRSKLEIQRLQETGELQSTIFKTVCVWIDGRTSPSSEHLSSLILKNGGKVMNTWQTQVTHIVAMNVPPARIRHFQGRRVVKPDWILQSLAKGRCLPHNEFMVDELRFPNGQKTLLSMFQVSKNSKPAGPIPSQNLQRKKPPTKSMGVLRMVMARTSTSCRKKIFPLSPGLKQPLNAPMKAAASPCAKARRSLFSDSLSVSAPTNVKPHPEPTAEVDRLDGDHQLASIVSLNFHESKGESVTASVHCGEGSFKASSDSNHVASPPPPLPSRSAAEADTSLVNMPNNDLSKEHEPPELNYCAEQVLGEVVHDIAAVGSGDTPVRLSEPELLANPNAAGAPRFSLNDSNFVENFFKNSRLHFIGSWNTRFEELHEELRQQTPLYYCSDGEAKHVVHIDMDCFFASVALRSRPHLVHSPVAISHSSNLGSAEVSTCNYVARTFGVKSGMFMKQAKSLCPNLQVLPYEFSQYKECSEAIYRIFYRYTQRVQPLSCDEALLELPYSIDVTGVVNSIRNEIHQQTRCSASAGIGPSILLARLATMRAKPNGCIQFDLECGRRYLDTLELRSLPDLGYSSARKLASLGITTIPELRALRFSQALGRAFGKEEIGKLISFANGLDSRVLKLFSPRQSLSAEISWGVRFRNVADVTSFLRQLATEVENRLKEARRSASQVTLTMKTRAPGANVVPSKFLGCGRCQSKSYSMNADQVHTAADLLRHLQRLFRRSGTQFAISDIRGIGCSVSKLQPLSDVARNMRIDRFFSKTVADKQPSQPVPASPCANEAIDDSELVLPPSPSMAVDVWQAQTIEFRREISAEVKAAKLLKDKERNSEKLARLLASESQSSIKLLAKTLPKAKHTENRSVSLRARVDVAPVEGLDENTLRELPLRFVVEARRAAAAQQRLQAGTVSKMHGTSFFDPRKQSTVSVAAVESSQPSVARLERLLTPGADIEQLRRELRRWISQASAENDGIAFQKELLVLLDQYRFSDVEKLLLMCRRLFDGNVAWTSVFNDALAAVQKSVSTELHGQLNIRPLPM